MQKMRCFNGLFFILWIGVLMFFFSATGIKTENERYNLKKYIEHDTRRVKLYFDMFVVKTRCFDWKLYVLICHKTYDHTVTGNISTNISVWG